MTSRSHEARRASEVLANDLVDLLQESVIISGPDGRVSAWNRASERLYGRRREHAIGRLVRELVGGQAPPSPADLAERLGKRQNWTGEVVRSNVGGAELVVKVAWTLNYDRNGLPAQIIETGVDLTRYKAAKHTLELTEARAREMLQTMEACVWELDISRLRPLLKNLKTLTAVACRQALAVQPGLLRQLLENTPIVDVNERTLALFGRSDPDVLLRGSGPFWPDESLGIVAHAVATAMTGAPAFTSRVNLQTMCGHRFDAFATLFLPPAMVARGRVLVGIIDLSPDERWKAALRESEAFYHDMFNTPTVAAWHLDARGARDVYARLRAEGVTDLVSYSEAHPGFIADTMTRIKVVDVNETAVQLFGAKDRSAIVGGSVEPFWIPGQYEATLGSMVASFTNQPSYRRETRMRTLNGNEIDVLFTVAASPELRDAGQTLVGIIDISERVRAQNAVAELQANLAHSARVSILGELTASIAHEVNQPLAAITTYGEAGLRWLDRPEPNLAEVRRLTTRMIADARRASDIIGRIRSMATPASVARQALVINELVKEAMLFLRPELRKHGVSEEYGLEDGLPMVIGDPVQLQQVLVNIALNGLQAMEHTARPRLTIRSRLAKNQPGKIAIEIEDIGTGLAPEVAERLFDSFVSTKTTGMGIGLPICRSIVEAHGGTIGIANVGKRGARATIMLPTFDGT